MGRKCTEYIVYDIKTDMPLVLGTTKECAKYLGLTSKIINNMAYLTKLGKSTQYEVFNLDELTKEDNE